MYGPFFVSPQLKTCIGRCSKRTPLPDIVSLPDLGLTYTSNTRNKSGDDCDELDADWMTVCHLFLEIYDTHNYRTQK